MVRKKSISNKAYFAFILLALALSALFLSFFKQFPVSENNDTSLTKIQVGQARFDVEIAQTGAQKSLGLGHRDVLPEGRGMLFVYSLPARYPFWMKGMRFDLDFVFINHDRVVALARNIPYPKPGETPHQVVAETLFDVVLELNAGEIDKHNLKVGDVFVRQN